MWSKHFFPEQNYTHVYVFWSQVRKKTIENLCGEKELDVAENTYFAVSRLVFDLCLSAFPCPCYTITTFIINHRETDNYAFSSPVQAIAPSDTETWN